MGNAETQYYNQQNGQYIIKNDKTGRITRQKNHKSHSIKEGKTKRRRAKK
jgi:hypothetical protein